MPDRREAARDLRQQTARKFQRRQQRQVHAARRPLRYGMNAPGPFAGDRAHETDRIAAGVHQRAACQCRVHADVAGIRQRKAKGRLNQLQAPDRLGRKKLPHFQRLRLRAVRIRFHQIHVIAARGIEHRARIGRRRGERLLAQHVLPGLDCPYRPLRMQIIGQRIVDRVDFSDRPAGPRRSRAHWGCRCPWRMPAPSRHRGSPPPRRRSCLDGRTPSQNKRAIFAAPNTPILIALEPVVAIAHFPLRNL